MLQWRLIEAVKNGDLPGVQALLSQGADPNAREEGTFMDTVLMIAAGKGHGKIVECLIASGARIDEKRQYELTALMVGAMNGRIDAVRVLADKGAVLDEKNVFGYTALIYAAGQGHTETARFLVARGANPDDADNNGNSVLSYAARHPAIAEILKDVIENRKRLQEQAAIKIKEEAREQMLRHREILRQKKPANPFKRRP